MQYFGYASGHAAVMSLCCLCFSDVQHHSDVPRWPGGAAGAGLHPRQQDPLPDSAGHVEERPYAEEREE